MYYVIKFEIVFNLRKFMRFDKLIRARRAGKFAITPMMVFKRIKRNEILNAWLSKSELSI